MVSSELIEDVKNLKATVSVMEKKISVMEGQLPVKELPQFDPELIMEKIERKG